MKFLYEYRTKDNVRHTGIINASTREEAYATLKAQGIRPGSVTDAPGFFNKLFGRGKRWIAIGVLAVVAVSLAVALGKARSPSAPQVSNVLDSTLRRQPVGDTVIIDKGVRTGWAFVFDEEGERFLASFAVPGVPAGQRNTTEEEILQSLSRKVEPTAGDSIEARQIKSMVEGMKAELRTFLADGGTVVEYGRRLVARQEQELRYYGMVKNELETAAKSRMSETALEELWENRNAKLRKMGIKLIPMPDAEVGEERK